MNAAKIILVAYQTPTGSLVFCSRLATKDTLGVVITDSGEIDEGFEMSLLRADRNVRWKAAAERPSAIPWWQ